MSAVTPRHVITRKGDDQHAVNGRANCARRAQRERVSRAGIADGKRQQRTDINRKLISMGSQVSTTRKTSRPGGLRDSRRCHGDMAGMPVRRSHAG